jgi:hypothetical protein
MVKIFFNGGYDFIAPPCLTAYKPQDKVDRTEK